ncbi:MAG TPA: hypothetical protein VK420_09985 [Longimicrobium sp.]|nr:hypothetical protein [Longimicrobium sp.]
MAGPPRRRGFVLAGLFAAALLLGLALARWPSREEAPPAASAAPAPPGAPGRASPSPRTPPPSTPSRAPTPAAVDGSLAAALGEEQVVLASRAVVEALEQDRPWVCAGEPMALSARVGGEREPGAVLRWVWPTATGAELHPGPTMHWTAPPKPGRYPVRFQVCRDLGGRRVGILAERAVVIEVRACGPGQAQEDEPLRLSVTQKRHGVFSFQAVHPGLEQPTGYAWDFGDGASATTATPSAEHAYRPEGLEPGEVRGFTVRLEARMARGLPLRATAFAVVRGRPSTHDPAPVDVELSRWKPRAEGGFQSDVVVRPPQGTTVTWDRVERITLYGDERADTVTRPFAEVIQVEERLEGGGFRGHVTVAPADVTPEVKQLLDFLYGRDQNGEEVVVSWSPYKREPPAETPAPREVPAK